MQEGVGIIIQPCGEVDEWLPFLGLFEPLSLVTSLTELMAVKKLRSDMALVGVRGVVEGGRHKFACMEEWLILSSTKDFEMSGRWYAFGKREKRGLGRRGLHGDLRGGTWAVLLSRRRESRDGHQGIWQITIAEFGDRLAERGYSLRCTRVSFDIETFSRFE
jgi:hypothetical protein